MHSSAVLSLLCLFFCEVEFGVGGSDERNQSAPTQTAPQQVGYGSDRDSAGYRSVLVDRRHVVSRRKSATPPQNTVVIILFIDSAVKCRENRCPLSLLFKLANLGFNHPSVVLTADVFHLEMLMKLQVTLKHFGIYSYNMFYIYLVTNPHALYGSITSLVTTEP